MPFVHAKPSSVKVRASRMASSRHQSFFFMMNNLVSENPSDQYKECLKHQILESGLASHMEKLMVDTPDKTAVTGVVAVGHEAFTINHDVEGPVNLVFSIWSLGCYQMVFKVLALKVLGA
ncbi:uncharacterized protein LOC142777098 [Rhipicephalus microplus]|uniref:uncharacterized protein LOC142777098 n=1 Tax=Rhipicephalus microplus TaxID=6941 RepID=UPI003F6A79EA